MSNRYKVSLSEDQLHTLIQALELKTRIGIGQFNEIWWQLEKKIHHDRSIESAFDLLSMKLGLKNLSSGSPNTHPEVKRCYDMLQVFRKKYADDNFDGKGGVWHYDPLFVSDVGKNPPTIEGEGSNVDVPASDPDQGTLF